MNDFAAKKGEVFTSHFDIVRRIETLTGEVPYAIKQFKAQVLSFLSMDKRLSSLKSKTEKNTSARKLERFETFVTEYKGAYKKCNQSHLSIAKTLDEISSLYARLSDFYYSDGKRREARRATADGEKYDNLSRKQLSVVFARIASASNISLAKKDDDAVSVLREAYTEKQTPTSLREESREEDVRMPKEESGHRFNTQEYGNNAFSAGNTFNSNNRYNQNYQYERNARYGASDSQHTANAQYNRNQPYNAPQYSGAPYQQGNAYGFGQSDYKMPPYYPQMQNVNITPISIDVNSAVESLFETFVRKFEERTAEYISKLELPEISPTVSGGEVQTIGKVLDDESFALEKLSAILEKTNNMLSMLSSLTAKYAELEEKTKSLSESMKNASDTQRNLAREIQGIQATQKVIGIDQLKLAEEQTIVLEAQKTAISRQAELSEIESEISNELASLLQGANSTIEGFKASGEAQNNVACALDEIIEANGKLLLLQKNLEEKQSELTEMQREAILAQKRISRSQKAVNERLGARTKKEKSADEGAVEASFGSEALV